MLSFKKIAFRITFKPLLFALLGAAGCFGGAIIGEVGLAFLPANPPPPQQQIDVLFVVDVTGSMQSEIDGIQAGIDNFIKQLSNQRLDSRVGLIAFKDRFIGEEPNILTFSSGDIFTNDINEFSRKVGTLRAIGGGDNPESSLDAVVLAARQPYRQDAAKTIILVTDAQPHIPDRDTISVQAAVQAITQNGIDQLHLVIEDRDAPMFEALQLGAPGKIFSLAKTAAERKGFDLILPQIGQQIALAIGTQSISATQFLPVLIAIAIWTACLAAGIFLALVMGQNSYLNRSLFPVNAATLASIAGVIVAGLLAGALGQLFYSAMANFNYFGNIDRIIAWAILGAVLGRGAAFFVPNLSPNRALVGGVIGGGIGAIAFLWVTNTELVAGYVGDIIGRLTGAAILGFFIGLMISLIEVVFREAWLEISYGQKESRTVNLGAEPISIGSDQNSCTIYARNTAPIAYTYHLQQGQVICKDAVSGTVTAVQSGHQQQVGNITVIVQGGKKQTLTVPSDTSSSSPKPPSNFSLSLSSNHTFLLTMGKKLGSQEIPGLASLNADNTVAEVTSKPGDATVLGLQNLSPSTWQVTLPNGEQRQVEPHRSIKLAAGTRINFGTMEGTIRNI